MSRPCAGQRTWRKRNLEPWRLARGMVEAKMASISSLGRLLNTATVRPPSALYAKQTCNICYNLKALSALQTMPWAS